MATEKEHYEKLYSSYRVLPHFRYEYNKVKHRLEGIFAGRTKPVAPNVIDLGCGLGIKTYVLSEFFRETVGLDFIENSVNVATLLNDRPSLRFVWEDVSAAEKSTERYAFITAFGLSVFNVKEADVWVENIRDITAKYATENHTLIIGSETDFSGKSPSGWYYHTRSELRGLCDKLQRSGYGVTLYFPYRTLRHYRGNGLLHLLLETYRLFFTRKREYYLILER